MKVPKAPDDWRSVAATLREVLREVLLTGERAPAVRFASQLCERMAAGELVERVRPGELSQTTLRVEMEREEAWALALLLKRLTWDEIRSCAVDNAEALVIREAIARVQSGLADIGVRPR